MKLNGMWHGEPRRLQPALDAVVQRNWIFHNPFSTVNGLMVYAEGEEVKLEFLVPASSNEPFGFPFCWGNDGKPYPVWLLKLKEAEG